MEKRKLIKAYLGDPLYSFRSVAQYAFRAASENLHQYHFMRAGHSDEPVIGPLLAIAHYFGQKGLQGQQSQSLSVADFLPVSGGTTEAYNLFIQYLGQDVRKRNGCMKPAIVPAILMPVPTYGLFMKPPQQEGFEVVTIRRDLENGGRLHQKDLINAIKAAHEKGLHIVAYYDCNPHNPLGIVRTEKETREVADVICALNEIYKREAETAASAQAEAESRPFVNMGMGIKKRPTATWDGPSRHVHIIDDMVYDGLVYSDRKPFYFSQIEECVENTVTLCGPSKAGLAGIRAGILIYNRAYGSELDRLRENNHYFPSSFGLKAMEAFYGATEHFAKARENHLGRLNREHRYNGLLMKALINGIDSMPEALASDRRKMMNDVVKYGCFTRDQARRLLQQGIPGIRVITTPEAGFFHVLDFSELKGRTFRKSESIPIYDEEAIHRIFDGHYNIKMASGQWTGLKPEDMKTRVSFAMPPKDILEFTKRLRQGVNALSPRVPAVRKSCCTASDPAPTL